MSIPFLLALCLLPHARSAVSPQVSGGERPQLSTALPEVAAKAPEANANDTLVIYDIADLTGQDRLDALARDITSGTLSEETKIAALDRYVELIESGATQRKAESLAQSIRDLIEPTLRAASQQVRLLNRGALTVVGNAAQHAWVDRFLGAARRFDGMIDIQTRILRVPSGALGDLVGGRTGKVLNDADLEALLRAIQKDEGCVEMTAQRLLVAPYERAECSVLDQTAYVRDFELTVLPDRQEEIVDPIIDVLQTGLLVSMRAVPLDGGRLQVRCELNFSSAARPFREHEVRIGALGSTLTIQLPEVSSVKANARFDIAPGQSMVMGTVDPGGAGKKGSSDVLIILKVGVTPNVRAEPGR
ncbi:MAG: hypothetical protein R3F49_13160 [Planctomycetota bacterium]